MIGGGRRATSAKDRTNPCLHADRKGRGLDDDLDGAGEDGGETGEDLAEVDEGGVDDLGGGRDGETTATGTDSNGV